MEGQSAPASRPAPPAVPAPAPPAVPAPGPPATTAAAQPPSKAHLVSEFSSRQPAQWGLEVAGVVTGSAAREAVLTLDACGGPGGSGVDHEVLSVLRRLNIPATLFLNARWIHENRSLAAELALDPLFELANHGWQHRPLSVTGRSAYGIPGTMGLADAYDELMGCVDALQGLTGQFPRFFRSGTAHVDEVAAEMARRLGIVPVNFTINADAGATLPPAGVAASLAGTGPGDIVIAHFNKPGSGTAAGFREALPRLLEGGTSFAVLGDVLPPL